MKRLTLFAKQQILKWIILVSLSEYFIFVFPKWQVWILLFIALAFLTSFIVKMLTLYSGWNKTLNLDLLSFCLVLSLVAIATGLKPTNTLILVLTPIFALPQIIYVIVKK